MTDKDFKCIDCKDTKKLLVESVKLDRGNIDIETGHMKYWVTGLDDWHEIDCHCVDE